MLLFWTVLLGIQVGGREHMICSKWKVEMFAKGLKMVYVSLTHRNINSISLILLLLVFHFGSHPLMNFFFFCIIMTDRTSSLVTACHGHCWLWYQGQGVMLRDLQKPFWAGTVSQTLVLISSAIAISWFSLESLMVADRYTDTAMGWDPLWRT